MSAQLPYQLEDTFKLTRKGMVRSGDTRQIIANNFTDLRPYLNLDFVTESPTSPGGYNRQPLAIYRLADGTGLIKGRVQYIGIPSLSTLIQVVDLSEFINYFNNYSFSGEINAAPRLIAPEPFTVDNNSWAVTVGFSSSEPLPTGINLLPNPAATSILNTNDFVYIELTFIPYIPASRWE